MQSQQQPKKLDERRLMAELDRERHESERDLPPEQRHADPDWLRHYWQRLAS